MKVKKIMEWLIIGLFIAIVASITSILIYRAVINSDWYNEKQTKKYFSEVVERVNNIENITNIKVDDNIEVRFINEAPVELFDDMIAKSYERIEDIEKRHEIFRQGCVTVFYKDATQDSFFITDDGELYWGTDLKIECPSLLEWYNSIVN